MARVYLETSFVSACVSDRTDAASSYRRETSREWWERQRQQHRLFVSDEVVAELSDPAFPRSQAALDWIAGIESLAVAPEAIGFARVLVAEKAMPGPLKGDAIHVAVATVCSVDFVLSWNVKHLANPNKVEHLGKVCLRFGLLPPRIVTPEFLWEVDDE
jgi:hypothetical protein